MEIKKLVEFKQRLAEAAQQLAHFQSLQSRSRSRDPHLYRAHIEYWQFEVWSLERRLKQEGVMAATGTEVLNFFLDKEFPAARSKDVVEFGGKKFQLQFEPATYTRDRQHVTGWFRWWQVVGSEAGYLDMDRSHLTKKLAEAAQQLAHFRSLQSRSRSRDPHLYRARIEYWKFEMWSLERKLKQEGVMASTAMEALSFYLDEEFPAARSKDVVEFGGKKFQLRFEPATYTRDRQHVTGWFRWWQVVGSEAC